jgi:hypothetical protein
LRLSCGLSSIYKRAEHAAGTSSHLTHQRMGSSHPLLRLLSLVLLLLPHPLRDLLGVNHHHPKDASVDLHPIVVVPGISCPDLEARLTEAYRPSTPLCGAMKGKGWFGLWENSSELLAHDYVQCFEEQRSLVYDPDINDYRNLPGVETRVPIAVTRRRNYSAHDIDDFFSAIDFEDGVEPFRRRTVPKMNYFQAPMCP